jgi:hypothetical protein
MYHHNQDATPLCTEVVAMTRLVDAASYHLLIPDSDNQASASLLSLLAALNSDFVNFDTLLAKREEVLRMVGEMIWEMI